MTTDPFSIPPRQWVQAARAAHLGHVSKLDAPVQHKFTHVYFPTETGDLGG